MKLCEDIKCRQVWSYRHFDEKSQTDVKDFCFGISEKPPVPKDVFTFCIIKEKHTRYSLTAPEVAHFLCGLVCLLESYVDEKRR